jgi:hypothetical protein
MRTEYECELSCRVNATVTCGKVGMQQSHATMRTEYECELSCRVNATVTCGKVGMQQSCYGVVDNGKVWDVESWD